MPYHILKMNSRGIIAMGKETMYAVLNPSGIKPSVGITPPAPRIESLSGKTVYCVSQHVRGADTFQRKVVDLLPQYAPGVNAIYIDKPDSFGIDSPELWDEIAARGNALIYAAAA
jgi:hypothetical protein